MPKYPTRKTFSGGFYNHSDAQPRIYDAEDLRRPYDVVYSDGVKPDADGTPGDSLAVTAIGGMTVSVGRGHAKLGGAWFENKDPYNIELDVGDSEVRYDCIIVANDDSEYVKAPDIFVRSQNTVPTVNDLARGNGVYEICIAYVVVPQLATSIDDSAIVDTRVDGELCNVMSGVGATVVRTYNNTYFSEEEGQTIIPIGIKQYDRTRDTLVVTIEGRVFAKDVNYTILDNERIGLTIGLPKTDTRVDIQVIKNVNAAGAYTVVAEVGALREEMDLVNKCLEHHYYCNGLNDNVEISKLAQAYINGGTDYGSMRLVVHGTFGAVSPYSGDGTSARNYFWLALGKDGASTNRKLIVDFTDCRTINLPIDAGTYNTVFSGNDVHVIGANVIANQSGANTYIRAFSSASGIVVAEDCRFWITATLTSYISQTGAFIRCRGSVTVNGASAYCFYATANAVLRVQGGEFYAYSDSGNVSAVVYQTAANAVVILYGINCPTTARGGYVQSYAVNASGKFVSMTDTITALPVSIPNGNGRGTLAISKPGMM